MFGDLVEQIGKVVITICALIPALWGVYTFFKEKANAQAEANPNPERSSVGATGNLPQTPSQELTSAAPSEAAKNAVASPGIALLSVGAIGCFFGLIGLLSTCMMSAIDPVDFAPQNQPAEQKGREVRSLSPKAYKTVMMLGTVLYFLQTLSGSVSVMGGLAMIRLKNHALVLAGCLAAICNPVLFWAGIPIAIWCLRVAHQPEVRPAFDKSRISNGGQVP